MSQPSSAAPRRTRPLLLLLVGLVLVAAAGVLVFVALTTPAEWAFLAALASFTVGLVCLGQLIAPGATSFRGGTKGWQNEGPGSSAGFGGGAAS